MAGEQILAQYERRDIMSEFNYDTYCGLYCGACSILKAYQSGPKDPFACFWDENTSLELKCHGCKTDIVFENCAVCPIRTCAREKEIEHCTECIEYPCANFNKMLPLLEILPHCTTASDNRETIAAKGTDQWLQEQDNLWKCPDCKTEYTWYGVNCKNCGRELDSLKPYKNAFNKDIMLQFINLMK